jgi:DNA-binding IclR family transcriptional regulator
MSDAAGAPAPKYSAPALEKGLDILELLAEQAVPMTQAQLARALNRQPTEIFRMLTCLEVRGYLRRDAHTGGYALTLKLFELSRTHSPYEEMLRTARPLMRRLAEALGESCHLSVLHRNRVLVLAQEESPKPFRLSVEVGSLHAPMSTTSGRILLAHLPDDARAAVLAEQPDWATLDARARAGFLKRLAEITRRGYEQTEGERFVGGLDLGVLVGAPGSTTKAALTIAMLAGREAPDVDAMVPAIKACAAAIAARAGLARKELAA